MQKKLTLRGYNPYKTLKNHHCGIILQGLSHYSSKTIQLTGITVFLNIQGL